MINVMISIFLSSTFLTCVAINLHMEVFVPPLISLILYAKACLMYEQFLNESSYWKTSWWNNIFDSLDWSNYFFSFFTKKKTKNKETKNKPKKTPNQACTVRNQRVILLIWYTVDIPLLNKYYICFLMLYSEWKRNVQNLKKIYS